MKRTQVNVETGEMTEIPYTEEEMIEYNAKKEAQEQKEVQQAQLQAAYDAAAAIFDAMPAGRRSFWKNIREDVATAIMQGDFTTVRELLETAPAPDAQAEVERQTFLSLFP